MKNETKWRVTHPSWPIHSKEEVEAVQEVLLSCKTNYWTGNKGTQFETEFSRRVGSKYGVALANGTVALEIALRALDIGIGDEVIVTCRTFLASVSSIINMGAIPIFADIDADTQNITAGTIEKKITKNTKAIVCVHLAGWPCDMGPITHLAREKNILVIEDCAQAHGARYQGASVGSHSDISCWSFCVDKIISTGGEGGMVTTDSEELWRKLWSYKDHGKNYTSVKEQSISSKFGFSWLHDSFGSNYHMTEMQAAIGLVQLKHLDTWVATRRKNAELIWESARGLDGIRVPELKCSGCDGTCSASTGCMHAAYKCYIFVEDGQAARDDILSKINDQGIPCYSGSCPEVYLEKAFANSDLRPRERLKVAKRLGETSLMFLCDPGLTNEDMSLACEVLRDSIKEYYRQKN